MRKLITAAVAISVGFTPYAASAGPGTWQERIAFRNYAAPAGFPDFDNAGETSIGLNPKTNAALLQLNLTTAKVTWDRNGTAKWKDVSHPPVTNETFDPILWTDRKTGRTFVSQLHLPMSLQAFTDDDGKTWQDTVPPVSAPSVDHQTVGGGPFATSTPRASEYPNAIYYCAQAGANMAQCARSDDGGLTWGFPIPFNYFDCQGLHGQVKVGHDGSVFVPDGQCIDDRYRPAQGVFVSRDGGTTWERVLVPGLRGRPGDPKIAFDRAGRLYFATVSAGRPVVSTSKDGGRSWSKPLEAGSEFGIRNAVFPMVVAGDARRAAFAFYGTKTGGNDQTSNFKGVWHLYVAYTFDGGASWTTIDATPTDPVQRGEICLEGILCDGHRNLLDFQDMTMDRDGRVLVSYADGCTGRCARPSGDPGDSTDELGVVARQASGPRLAKGAAPVPRGVTVRHRPGPPKECQPGKDGCLPTLAQCASGNYNGVWQGKTEGEAALCVGGNGTVVSYIGGYAPEVCGVIVLAGRPVLGFPSRDPNTCFQFLEPAEKIEKVR